MVYISPSILSADFTRLGEECKMVLAAGADFLHIDVMDGHFVPNLTIGMPVLKALSAKVPAVYDVHLMIQNPEKYIDEFAKSGSDYITFHIECGCDIQQCISSIHAHGLKAGLSVKPGTDVKLLKPYLSMLDLVLVMSVEPGFGGQAFMPEMLKKIEWLKKQKSENEYNYFIEVDGGVNLQTAPLCRNAGAEILVAGSAVFLAKDPAQAIKDLRK